jgi:tetratricopeptide (TPR) repeat protein
VRKRAEKRRASSSHVGAASEPAVSTSKPTVVAAAAVPVPAVVATPAEPLPTEPAPLDASTETATELVPKDASAAREQAKALVAEARKLKNQGKKDAALKKMFEATRVDKRYAAAWDGLRDLHFQKGAYHEAAQYGEKAVKLAPTNGPYHLRLGEAHWKLADYAAAEKAWKSAQALGVAQAKDRLEALRKR